MVIKEELGCYPCYRLKEQKEKCEDCVVYKNVQNRERSYGKTIAKIRSRITNHGKFPYHEVLVIMFTDGSTLTINSSCPDIDDGTTLSATFRTKAETNNTRKEVIEEKDSLEED
jgi:hypothetical protein